MQLRDAYTLAERIKGVLVPFCERIEIVGSIRRARDHVNDVDFVVLPRSSQEEQLRATLRKCPVIKDGPQTMIVKAKNGAQIDVWFAHNGTGDLLATEPSNWGSLLLCRTGSKEHNIYIAQLAQKQGLKWEISRGLVQHFDMKNSRVIASATEEEIFQALGLPFIPPVEREVRTAGGNITPNCAEAFGGDQGPLPPAAKQIADELHGAVDQIKRHNGRGLVRLPGGTMAFID